MTTPITIRGRDATVTYQDFVARKALVTRNFGFAVSGSDVHPALFDHQRALTRWAVRKGRCAVFADTGLGKTPIQVEWCRLVGGRSLIIAPLSVARQTATMARDMLGVYVHYTRSGSDLINGINITNYEMLQHFSADAFDAVALDESSILKAIDGKTRRRLTEMFRDTPFRSCYSATPAPNDRSELGRHAEFLGVMTEADMLATFFVHDDDGWRLKGHAQDAFYRWLASWGMSVRKPSDIGYSDEGYNLPPLTTTPLWLDNDHATPGALFFMGLHGIQDRTAARRAALDTRIERVAELVNANAEQWVVWHGLNPEGHELARLIPDAVLVEGSQKPEEKVTAFEAFQDGRYRVLITKPRIGGYGLNLQNASRTVFCGLSDSWEDYYQCIRRLYRFGQARPVEVYAVLSRAEAEIWENVQRKEAEAREMSDRLIEHVRAFEREELDDVTEADTYRPAIDMRLPDWLQAA